MKIAIKIVIAVLLVGCINKETTIYDPPKQQHSHQNKLTDLYKKIIAYEGATSYCESIPAANESINLPVSLIKDLSFTRSEVFKLTIYFTHINFLACMGNSKRQLELALEKLQDANKEIAAADKLAESLRVILSESEETLESITWFSQLPQGQQASLNEVFLGKLFKPSQISNFEELREVFTDMDDKH